MKLFAALLLISIASGLPSDEIKHVASPEIVDLQHVDPAVPKAFSAQDGNLSMFNSDELPNLGHYCTWTDTEVQTEAVLTDSQKAVLANVPSNKTGKNATAINSTGLIYL